jgi:hypothetical protein
MWRTYKYEKYKQNVRAFARKVEVLLIFFRQAQLYILLTAAVCYCHYLQYTGTYRSRKNYNTDYSDYRIRCTVQDMHKNVQVVTDLQTSWTLQVCCQSDIRMCSNLFPVVMTSLAQVVVILLQLTRLTMLTNCSNKTNTGCPQQVATSLLSLTC